MSESDSAEAARIRALHELGVLDSPADDRFDRLTRLARRLFNTPIALVSLVDSDRQWFKSRSGLDASQTPRAVSFCAHAIQGEEVMVVEDATDDERFVDNDLVTGAPNIRFYAGCPVRGPNGHKLGTICVIDHEPRELDEEDTGILRDLAEMVESELKAIQLAMLDDLTGLSNRRGFNAIAHHSLALCERMEQPAAVLMFDLDGFKEVNDSLGHAAGDRVLQRFAERLLRSFRDSDVVARLGGDEFCVLLSGAKAEQAPNALAHLEDTIRDDTESPTIQYSVGVTQYDPKKHSSVTALLEDADEEMYDDKGEKEASR
ncbi:MAG: sensor domain-containing diguanylate cyclase [Gemmatimonadetes bacterium]|nr:sensor domain-containing diguanylate cyclase [Gemmatimonadota bacterium]